MALAGITKAIPGLSQYKHKNGIKYHQRGKDGCQENLVGIFCLLHAKRLFGTCYANNVPTLEIVYKILIML